MRKITNLFIIALIIGSALTPNKANAQMPGSLVPIILLKHATGYWDESDDSDVEEIVIVDLDSDGDGITDKDDACPNVKGTKSLNGCPDADGDGVTDKDDVCPNEKGTIANKGCLLSEKEILFIKEASSHIYFESGSAKIKKESYTDLDKLAALLKKHPEVKATVEGHTDNTGNAEKNLTLSKARAESVKKYLIEHGEQADHMSSEGYGITKPVATNDTKEGRAKNRRVEIVIAAFIKK